MALLGNATFPEGCANVALMLKPRCHHNTSCALFFTLSLDIALIMFAHQFEPSTLQSEAGLLTGLRWRADLYAIRLELKPL